MYGENVNSFIPKIINTIDIINDFNNIFNNQINISSIELITQKNPLMSLNINNLKTPIEEIPNELTDDKLSLNEFLIDESEDLFFPNVSKTNILPGEGKDKIEINLLNQLELLKFKNNLLKKRFEEMKKQNNELNQDLLNKIISKKDLDKPINIFKEEINSLEEKYNAENVREIRKKYNIINELNNILTLISAKIHYQLYYYISDKESIIINDIKKEIQKEFVAINTFSKKNTKLYNDIKNNIKKQKNGIDI